MPRPAEIDHAARLARAASSFRLVRTTWIAAMLALLALGCEPTATVGAYSDAGARCDPLADACGPSMACTLRADPSLDACRASGGLTVGAACNEADACAAGAQCVALGASTASLDPADLAPGICAAICARDASTCDAAARCIGLVADDGVRIDFGVCATP
ncbi:MAG: hypothetical protein M3Y87_29730 [Myxococcota bacterium]|nr:hypothetical protein [Myxococcota bacterium]